MALSPLVIGLILAYLLSPLVELMDKKLMSKVFFSMPEDPIKRESRLKLRRTLSVLFTFVLLIVAICLIIYAFALLIVGQLVFDSFTHMIESLQKYFFQYEEELRTWAANLPNSGLEEKLQEIINSAVSWLADSFNVSSVIQFVTGLGGSILNIFQMCIRDSACTVSGAWRRGFHRSHGPGRAGGDSAAIYLIKDKDFFLRLWRKALHVCLPMGPAARVTETLNDVNTILSQFLRGQLLDALIVAILSSIALTITCLLYTSVLFDSLDRKRPFPAA